MEVVIKDRVLFLVLSRQKKEIQQTSERWLKSHSSTVATQNPNISSFHCLCIVLTDKWLMPLFLFHRSVYHPVVHYVRVYVCSKTLILITCITCMHLVFLSIEHSRDLVKTTFLDVFFFFFLVAGVMTATCTMDLLSFYCCTHSGLTFHPAHRQRGISPWSADECRLRAEVIRNQINQLHTCYRSFSWRPIIWMAAFN